MAGIKTTYTLATADVEVVYSKEHRCRAVGWMPSGTVEAVLIFLHGGGWIAQTRLFDQRFDPGYQLLEKASTDALLNAGVAVYWAEYPYGQHANTTGRVYPSYRFPQIPRAIGRLVQYLKTHALDSLATGSVDIALPQSDAKYGFWGNSAGSIMATWLALQPDGFLDYDPTLRAQSLSKYAYTHSHRVRMVIAQDCATDFRKIGGLSAPALAYFGASGQFYKDTLNNSSILSTDKFTTLPTNVKAVASPLVSAEIDFDDNLNVGVMISNAISPSEASYLGSGVSLLIDPTLLTGTPVAGDIVTSSGTPAGVFRYHDTDNDYLYIDGTAGTIAEWKAISGGTPSLTFSGSGATLATGTDIAPGILNAIGNDARKTFLDEAAALAIWDALDESEPISDLAQPHDAIYALPFKRARDAQFAAASVTSIDRYRIGNRYVASLDSFEAAHPWNATDMTTDVLDYMDELGMIP